LKFKIKTDGYYSLLVAV